MGFYDSRSTMQAYAGSSFLDPVADDPAMGQYTPVYMGAMNGEMKEYLGIRAEVSDSCCGIDFAVNGQWDYGTPEKPEQCLEAAICPTWERNPPKRSVKICGHLSAADSFIGLAAFCGSLFQRFGREIRLRRYRPGREEKRLGWLFVPERHK